MRLAEPAEVSRDAADQDQARRLQVLRRSDLDQLPEQSHRCRRSERLRQVEHHRRGALGDGRAVRQAPARRLHGRCRVQRLGGAQAGRHRLRRTGVRQQRRQDRRRLRRATTRSRCKRLVSRDGSSTYFINGARCRRKDITQLFLGTGLGSRSYAIIEQGMISRVIEAKRRGHARLHRGGRRHLALQGAPPGDRGARRRHA